MSPEKRWSRFLRADSRAKASMFGRLALRVLLAPIEFAVSLLLKAVSGGRPVRIGRLNAKGRITVMISYIEPYLRKLSLDGQGRTLLIVLNPGKNPNTQLTRMYRRVLWLFDDETPILRAAFGLIFRILRLRNSKLVAHLKGDLTGAVLREYVEGTPSLSFTEAELEEGAGLLDSLGLRGGASFICMGLRESAYYQQFLTADSQERHPNPEAREDARNAPLENYLPMADRAARQGYHVLRMGQAVGQPIPPTSHPRIIDYATKSRTPFGDIYLLAHCDFVVAGSAGLWFVSHAFNRPVVLADHYHAHVRLFKPADLFILKKVWSISEKRILTFREMIQRGPTYSLAKQASEHGLEMIHNTPHEVAAVVDEMIHRIRGTWRESEEDQELQRRFDALFTPADTGYGLKGRLGAAFLRENRNLLA